MVLYQLFVRYFGNKATSPVPGGTLEQNGCGTFADIDDAALDYLQTLGADALWLTGIIDHATLTAFPKMGREADHPAVVKGEAGSPYAIRDYYGLAPSLSRSPETLEEDFTALLTRARARGLKVIIDFVPNHTARHYRPSPGHPDPAANDDPAKAHDAGNFYIYLDRPLTLPEGITGADAFVEDPAKATGNDVFSATPSVYDWYETVKINHGPHPQRDHVPSWRGDPPVSWSFLLGVLEYWAGRGVDGFRCDMVDMLPDSFWHWAIARLRARWPDLIIIGESYVPDRYGPLLEAGFTYLYDKVGVYDGLMDWVKGKDQGRFGEAVWTLRHLDHRLLRFTENHDEPRRLFLEPSTQTDARAAAAFALTAALADGGLMIYNGQELGEYGADAEGFSGPDGKSTIFDYWPVPTLSALGRSAYDPQQLDDRTKGHITLYQTLNAWSKVTRGGKRFHLDMADAEYREAKGLAHPAGTLIPKALIKQSPSSGQLYMLVATGQADEYEGDVFVPMQAFAHFKEGIHSLDTATENISTLGTLISVTPVLQPEGVRVRYRSYKGVLLYPLEQSYRG